MEEQKVISPLSAFISAIGVILLLPAAITLVGLVGTITGLFNPIFASTGTWLVLILAGSIIRREGLRWSDLGFRSPDVWGKAILGGIIATILSFIVVSFVITVLTMFGIPTPDTSVFGFLKGNTAIYIPFMILIVWGSAAIGEELLARGFLMNRFEIIFRHTQTPWLAAAAAQALLFGLAHAYQGMSGVIITGIVGFILALTYQFTGRNLVAPIVAHGLIDSVSITSLYLGVTS